MGSKKDGHECKFLKSDCCGAPIRFETYGEGFSIRCWCEECGNYKYHGRIEGLLALWLGDNKSIVDNVGHIPQWLARIINSK